MKKDYNPGYVEIEMTTIERAKEYLYVNYEIGVECPCCKQFVKEYKRKITSTMAFGLIKLAKYCDDNNKKSFHLEDVLRELDLLKIVRSDFPKLRYWGLINQLSGKREDGSSRSGQYEITAKGMEFIESKRSVSKYVHIYNNKPYKKSGKLINIKSALGQRFNYNELMGYEE